MKKKILVKAPALSLSGYGEQARFALSCLRQHENKFDIYLSNIPWGKTGWVITDSEELKWYLGLMAKTQQFIAQKGQFDISLQITIPNEFEKLAPINIGYTAGIETTKVSPHWIDKARMMNKIIVVSNHSKQVYDTTEYKLKNEQNGQIIDFKNITPIEVVHFPVKKLEPKQIELDLTTDFNFLSVAQWGPRKNVEATIVSFLEEFKNDENVGLVLKINHAKNCIMDRIACEKRINAIKNSHKDAKCKVYLLHGNMTEEEMAGLYRHPKIKAIVTTTHGEGFGLPLFEAVCAGLPVIAPKWSGHVDFLMAPVKEDGKERMRNHFTTIDFDLMNVNKEAVWEGVIQADAQWCHVKTSSVKDAMRTVFKNLPTPVSKAKKLQEYILEQFSEEKQKQKFIDVFKDFVLFEEENVDDLIHFTDTPTVKNTLEKISFCISTNGKKADKTKSSILSIKNTMSKQTDINYEIVVAGNVEPFASLEGVVLKDCKEEADSGKLAKMRNIAASVTSGDVLVFLDDDVIFDELWASKLKEYNTNNVWDILGNKILLPNGDRYWDRAVVSPHQMVSYDIDDTDRRLYQTGCFWVVRKQVFEKHKWNPEIAYYAEKTGGINEDVEYSLRLRQLGYKLKFDKNNLVWHWDDSYREIKVSADSSVCLKVETIPENMVKPFEVLNSFTELITKFNN